MSNRSFYTQTQWENDSQDIYDRMEDDSESCDFDAYLEQCNKEELEYILKKTIKLLRGKRKWHFN